MWTFYEKNKQAIHDIVLLLAAVLGCCLFFRYLFRIFLPFLIGWLLSLLFNPLADRLQKFHIPRGISAIIGILLLFALLGLLGFWSGTGLIAKLKELSENLPHYISLFETGLSHFWTRFDTLAQRLPKTLQVFFSSLQTDSSGFLLSLVPKGSATGKLGGVSGFFIAFFVSLISAYFFTKDRDLLRRQYEIHIAPLFGLSVYTTKQELKASVLGYLKTQLILMGFVFIVTLIGMLVLHSPHPLLLSILIAIIDALLRQRVHPLAGRNLFLHQRKYLPCHRLSGTLWHHPNNAANPTAENSWHADWAASPADAVLHVFRL